MTALSTVQALATWSVARDPLPPIDLSSERAQGVADLARRHRVSGVVLAALDAGAAVRSPSALRTQLVDDQLALLRQTLQAEADLVRAARLLDDAGVEFRVLKGLATSHLDHSDPAMRATNDVDLLVRENELSIATSVLEPVTDRPGTVPDRRRRHVDTHGKDRTIRLTSGGWLDLHRLIAPAYWGFSIGHDDVFDRHTSFTVAGTELRALSVEWRFLHAVLHAGYSNDISMHSARDVLTIGSQLAQPAGDLLDASPLRSVRGLLAEGIRRTETTFGVEAPGSAWARTSHPGFRERLALRTRGLDGSRDHWSGPLALAPWRWPGYLAPLAAPSRSYLDWYGRSRRAHVGSARRARHSRRDDP